MRKTKQESTDRQIHLIHADEYGRYLKICFTAAAAFTALAVLNEFNSSANYLEIPALAANAALVLPAIGLTYLSSHRDLGRGFLYQHFFLLVISISAALRP